MPLSSASKLIVLDKNHNFQLNHKFIITNEALKLDPLLVKGKKSQQPSSQLSLESFEAESSSNPAPSKEPELHEVWAIASPVPKKKLRYERRRRNRKAREAKRFQKWEKRYSKLLEKRLQSGKKDKACLITGEVERRKCCRMEITILMGGKGRFQTWGTRKRDRIFERKVEHCMDMIEAHLSKLRNLGTKLPKEDESRLEQELRGLLAMMSPTPKPPTTLKSPISKTFETTVKHAGMRVTRSFSRRTQPENFRKRKMKRRKRSRRDRRKLTARRKKELFLFLKNMKIQEEIEITKIVNKKEEKTKQEELEIKEVKGEERLEVADGDGEGEVESEITISRKKRFTVFLEEFKKFHKKKKTGTFYHASSKKWMTCGAVEYMAIPSGFCISLLLIDPNATEFSRPPVRGWELGRTTSAKKDKKVRRFPKNKGTDRHQYGAYNPGFGYGYGVGYRHGYGSDYECDHARYRGNGNDCDDDDSDEDESNDDSDDFVLVDLFGSSSQCPIVDISYACFAICCDTIFAYSQFCSEPDLYCIG